ncbi:MAG: hypothetical protein U1F61_08150 [Opitutaceae bacterium]
MNKFYVISPLVLCAIFGVFYYTFIQEQDVKIAKDKQEKAQKAAVEKAKKDEAEAKARADADERVKKREEEMAKKDAERRAKWEGQGKEIADSTAKYNSEADRAAKTVAELEIQLADLRKKKEIAGREAFELQKAVELARIAKRNAELEVQRLHAMVAKRASESGAAQLPPPPVVAKTP